VLNATVILLLTSTNVGFGIGLIHFRNIARHNQELLRYHELKLSEFYGRVNALYQYTDSAAPVLPTPDHDLARPYVTGPLGAPRSAQGR